MALTDKQAMFVECYLTTFNATVAAEKAGYKGDRNGLASIGHTNLKKDDIAEAISLRIKEAAMGADEVLMRLAEQARASYASYINVDGSVDLDKIVKDKKTHLIKSVKYTPYGKNIEFHDAQAALQLIGRHHKMFVDKTELTGADGGPLEIVVRRGTNIHRLNRTPSGAKIGDEPGETIQHAKHGTPLGQNDFGD